jgi:hypothetical protein
MQRIVYLMQTLKCGLMYIYTLAHILKSALNIYTLAHILKSASNTQFSAFNYTFVSYSISRNARQFVIIQTMKS